MSDPVLDRIGLTKEQVQRATAGMRLPVTKLRAQGDPLLPWMWSMLKTWRSFEVHTLAAMARVSPKMIWNATEAMIAQGYPVGYESIIDGSGKKAFVCLEELLTPKEENQEL